MQILGSPVRFRLHPHFAHQKYFFHSKKFLYHTERKDMTPEGIEPSTFGFGIRRATNYAMESKPREGHWHGSKDNPPGQSKQNRQKGPIGIRTRIGGFRVLSDSHYTIGPKSEEIATLGFTSTGHTTRKAKIGVSGFRSQYLVLAKDARFQLRQYPTKRIHRMNTDLGNRNPPTAKHKNSFPRGLEPLIF